MSQPSQSTEGNLSICLSKHYSQKRITFASSINHANEMRQPSSSETGCQEISCTLFTGGTASLLC